MGEHFLDRERVGGSNPLHLIELKAFCLKAGCLFITICSVNISMKIKKNRYLNVLGNRFFRIFFNYLHTRICIESAINRNHNAIYKARSFVAY